MLIYIVEDDGVIASNLAKELERHDFQTEIANDFQHIHQEVMDLNPNLILLDINLPYRNGYYWCSQIRLNSEVPIIFISSLTESMDQLMAMQMGADDYITKPIDMPLTIAKIQAVLRRTYAHAPVSDQLQYGGVKLDSRHNQLKIDQHTIDLTHTERLIMASLIKEQGAYVSRNQLLDAYWQNDQYIDDNTLAVNISRLRKKLGEIEINDLIHTKRNEGYRIDNYSLEEEV